jgi:hypothetical protein
MESLSPKPQAPHVPTAVQPKSGEMESATTTVTNYKDGYVGTAAIDFLSLLQQNSMTEPCLNAFKEFIQIL